MPLPFRFTPRAVDDLDEIWSYIARDSVCAADRVEEAIFDACLRLSRFPEIGTRRREITALPVRFWTLTRYPNYVVVYRPGSRPLEIVTVLYGRRDLRRAMEETEEP